MTILSPPLPAAGAASGGRVEPARPAAGIVVNARFLTHRITGVQRYAYEVTSRLDGSRLVSPAAPHPCYPAAVGDRARIHRSRVFRSHLWEQAVLPRHVPRDALLFSPANAGPLAVRNQVLTVHDVSPLDHPEWFSRAYTLWYGRVLPLLARRVRHILTVSEFSRGRILDLFDLPEDRVTAIPNGICERFSPPAESDVSGMRARMGLDGPYVAVVGSLDPRKNLATLFRAWRQVHARRPDLTLAVAGATARCFPSLGIDQPAGVRMLGYVTDADLPLLYGGAETFVFPSLYEGFGLPPLEAMRCGTPVIVSRATSLPEAVGDAAIYVDPSSQEEIASGILRLAGDSALRRDLARRGEAHARRFTWEETARRTLETLSTLLTSSRNPVMNPVLLHRNPSDVKP
jgi:glycosyltransferase involved in cell wall biosynthesis